MASNLPPEGEQQINSTILKMAEEYAASEVRSHNENVIRKNIRDNADKLGIPGKAWRDAISMTKHMTDGERRDYDAGVKRVLGVIEDVAPTLFPDDVARAKKRAERKAAATAENAPGGRSQEELDKNTDTSERSDPNAGGAAPKTIAEAAAASEAAVQQSIRNAEGGPQLRVVGTGDEADVKSNVPPNPPDEEAEGEAALNAGMPLSQSAQAAAKRAAAKVP